VRPRLSRSTRAAALLGAAALAVVTVASCGSESEREVPAGSVAIVEDVEDGAVSDEDYEAALEQSAVRVGLDEPPEPGAPEFAQVNQAAMQALLFGRWVEGEAGDRGIEVTEADTEEELARIQDSFENQKEFKRAVRQSGFCSEEEIEADVSPIECEDVLDQARLLALQRRLQSALEGETDAEGADATTALNEAQQEFIDKWTERTTCEEEVAIGLCSGFEAPESDSTSQQAPDPGSGG
jgi:hypothetical protein